MVNYRVADLDAMLEQLRTAGAEVDEKVEEHEYGRFGWAVDPEGNRFELWQPPEGFYLPGGFGAKRLCRSGSAARPDAASQSPQC